jgi:DNA-binding SARP family transcriptional activator
LGGCGSSERGISEVDDLINSITFYKGDFLEGLSLADSSDYEEWMLNRRQFLKQQMLQALCMLADGHEQAGEYAQAEVYAHRQLELEPWLEKAHQQLMRVLL